MAIPREDYLLAHTRHLAEFVDRLTKLYEGESVAWGWQPELKNKIKAVLEQGTVNALQQIVFALGDASPRPVFKTPGSAGLEHFQRFFPNGKLILLVRDGRDTVHSMMRTEWLLSYGADFEQCVGWWAEGAASLLRFMEEHDEAPFWKLVKYEDLCRDLRGTLAGLLDFLMLSNEDYPFEQAAALPVYGSSSLGAFGPVPKSPGFQSVGRFVDWRSEQLFRFEQLAGGWLERLGYARSF